MVEFRQECREPSPRTGSTCSATSSSGSGLRATGPTPTRPWTSPPRRTSCASCMKFAQNGTLYRGSKPVMWSVVEKTALAEAEVEYEDYVSDQVWVKFPVRNWNPGEVGADLAGAAIVIWTTTPWTIPGNRAISFSPKISYALYEVTDLPADNWAKVGDKLILAEKLADDVFRTARVVGFKRLSAISVESIVCSHPLRALGGGYEFWVPLLEGDHVTDETGTGFVHTAPGHGREDFDGLDGEQRTAGGSGRQHNNPLYGRRRRPTYRSCSGVYRQARAHRQG